MQEIHILKIFFLKIEQLYFNLFSTFLKQKNSNDQHRRMTFPFLGIIHSPIHSFVHPFVILLFIVFIASYYRQLSTVIKMKNYKIKPVLLAPKEWSPERCYTILYMIIQYSREPVLIQRIIIGFEAILEKYRISNF